MRKAKAHFELSLTKDMKDKKKGFYKYTSSKGKIRGNTGLLLTYVSILVMEDTEKVQSLNTFLAPVFTAENGSQESQTSEGKKEDLGNYQLVNLTSILGK
ncbi:rna-directed dna polymerase from mobile element jockey-like [Pitangus sulphuratus]|nr:rna-directed dna polymerase from mobile element jockey-like [Pitangus sulphuratus]